MNWFAPLLVIVLIQTAASYLMRFPPAVSPELLQRIGQPEAFIGYVSGAITFGSVIFLVFCASLDKAIGAIRTLQIGLILGAAGTVLFALPFAWSALIGALLIGVCYGPSITAASGVVHNFTPKNRRNLIFSVKQAGVPLGGAVAGLILPLAIGYGGWTAGLLVTIIIVLGVALASQIVRRQVDILTMVPDVSLRSVVSPERLKGPFMTLAVMPALRNAALGGAALAVAQGCWLAFIVVHAVENLHFSLEMAGLFFAVMQGASVPGRLIFGWVADRVGSGPRMLVIASIASAATTLILAMTTVAWPIWALFALGAVAGITVMSWNGVQLAEMARLAPAGQVGEVAAAATTIIFLSYSIGPALFALAITALDRFDIPFAITALITLSAVVPFSRLRPEENTAGQAA